MNIKVNKEVLVAMPWQTLISTTNVRDAVISPLEKMTVMIKQCSICEGFSDSQREMLSTPTYRIRKDKKAGILVSQKDVTVLSSIDSEPTFQSPSGAIAQPPAQPPSSQPPAIASTSTPSSPPPPSYVTAEQLSAICDKWAEQFARMEALLSRGNVFSTPVSSVKPGQLHLSTR